MAIVIVKGRFGFTNALFNARQFNGAGPFTYSGSVLIEKGSDEAKLVTQEIEKVAKEAWGARSAAILEGIRGNSMKFCYVPGDTKTNENYHGMMVLTAKRADKHGHPKIVDRNPQVELSVTDGKPYAGSYGKLKVDIWAQKEAPHGPAIRATLIAAQFLEDGEAFSPTGPASADGFKDEGDDPNAASSLI